MNAASFVDGVVFVVVSVVIGFVIQIKVGLETAYASRRNYDVSPALRAGKRTCGATPCSDQLVQTVQAEGVEARQYPGVTELL